MADDIRKTDDELEATAADPDALSDDELEDVSGGALSISRTATLTAGDALTTTTTRLKTSVPLTSRGLDANADKFAKLSSLALPPGPCPPDLDK